MSRENRPHAAFIGEPLTHAIRLDIADRGTTINGRRSQFLSIDDALALAADLTLSIKAALAAERGEAEEYEPCGPGVHSFNSEDATVCACGQMRADGTYRTRGRSPGPGGANP